MVLKTSHLTRTKFLDNRILDSSLGITRMLEKGEEICTSVYTKASMHDIPALCQGSGNLSTTCRLQQRQMISHVASFQQIISRGIAI